jgi:hypothetical protein
MSRSTLLVSSFIASLTLIWSCHRASAQDPPSSEAGRAAIGTTGHCPNRVKLSFADFEDLLPRVLPKTEVSVRVSPNRSMKDLKGLSFSCTSWKNEHFVPSVGLVIGNIFASRYGDALGMEDISLVPSNSRIVCLAIPFVRFEQELFSNYISRYLGRLKILEAGGSSISVEHLSLLSKWCPDLIAIDLSDTKISASELNLISGLNSNLRAVSIGGISGDAEEFNRLIQHWPDIEQLYLHGTNVDDSVFESLSKLTRLRVLDLSNTNVSEQAFLAYLRRVHQQLSLERLYLPRIRSKDLAHSLQPSLLVVKADNEAE